MTASIESTKALYDCPKCRESFRQGELANRIKRRRCCTEEERFWVRVKKGDGCWPYSGAKLPKEIGGYGWVSFGGKRMGAHRVSWLLTNGPIPHGLHVLHRCDNGPCCNPEHLFLGTHIENMKDMYLKDRYARGASVRAKLTEEQAREILGRKPARIRGNGIAGGLAAQFGITVGAVYAIWRRTSWKHLTNAPRT